MASKEVRLHIYNVYIGAVKHSLVWIRWALMSFVTVSDIYLLTQPSLYFVSRKSVPNFKMDKIACFYGLSKKKGQGFGRWIYAYKKIVKDKIICSQIRGTIESSKWCKLWRGLEFTNSSEGQISYDYMD